MSNSPRCQVRARLDSCIVLYEHSVCCAQLKLFENHTITTGCVCSSNVDSAMSEQRSNSSTSTASRHTEQEAVPNQRQPLPAQLQLILAQLQQCELAY